MKFDQIPGQKRAKRMLIGAIKNKRVANAYIFLGPERSDLSAAAIAFACALNCEISGKDPCDECPSCKKIDKGIHPDVFTLRPDGRSIKIDQIRELITYTRFGPQAGKWKVCIIEDAHAMTPEAANSFLKTLEEPLSNIVFILLTGTLTSMPQTVISRCQQVLFTSDDRMPVPEDLGSAEDVRELFECLRAPSKKDSVKLLELSNKIGGAGDDVEENLEFLIGMFWNGPDKPVRPVKIVLSALSSLKKRANSRLALDVMCLKLGDLSNDN